VDFLKSLPSHQAHLSPKSMESRFICQSTSGTIVQQLTAEGFIDEYLFVLTPVVLGAGKPLFQDVKQFPLELLEARDFHSGNVLLHYSIAKKQ